MAKELPFFKFFPGEWVTGDITMVSMEAQGVFTNLCCYYWMRNCSISLANAKQRFSNNLAAFEELLKCDVIKVTDDDQIVINFLDEQMNEFVNVSEKRAKAGSAGGKAKAKQLPKFTVANPSYKDKEKEEDKDKNIGAPAKPKFTPPSLSEIKDYCNERKNNIDPAHFFDYNEARGWMVGKNKMKDWKAAIRTWEKNDFSTAQKTGVKVGDPRFCTDWSKSNEEYHLGF